MDLGGKFLIAMPALGDPRFDRSVVLVCSHSVQGSMGLIVNKPLPEIGFSDLLGQIGIAQSAPDRRVPVHYGGPVEPGLGFVLHGDDWQAATGTLPVAEGLAMTANQVALQALAAGAGPAQALLALGYAGWAPGQLESEIARNDWLTADSEPDLVFDSENGGKWTAALAALRIDPLTLSSTAGRA